MHTPQSTRLSTTADHRHCATIAASNSVPQQRFSNFSYNPNSVIRAWIDFGILEVQILIAF